MIVTPLLSKQGPRYTITAVTVVHIIWSDLSLSLLDTQVVVIFIYLSLYLSTSPAWQTGMWLIASVGTPLTGCCSWYVYQTLLLVLFPTENGTFTIPSCLFFFQQGTSVESLGTRLAPDQSIHVGSLVLFQQGIVTGSHAVGWCVAPSCHVTDHIPYQDTSSSIISSYTYWFM